MARGHAAPLKLGSTVLPHSSSSHSGTQHRFLFCTHQVWSSSEEVYISALSCSCLTRSSNSVASAVADRIGHPQLGFPRLRSQSWGSYRYRHRPRSYAAWGDSAAESSHSGTSNRVKTKGGTPFCYHSFFAWASSSSARSHANILGEVLPTPTVAGSTKNFAGRATSCPSGPAPTCS